MQHEIGLFRPTTSSYTDADTAANGYALLLVAVGAVVGFILWLCYLEPAALVAVLTAWPTAATMFYLSHTHVEKTLTISERNLYRRYRSLDPEVRVKVPLDIKTIKTISEDASQFRSVCREIYNLYDAQTVRKR